MIGVYGGTFNPVHYGHLRTALEVKEAFGLEQIRMVPCRIPALRAMPTVSAEMRFEMLQIATHGMANFIVDRRELDRQGPSYTVDTLQSLRSEYPDTGLILFIGVDAFANLERWHNWRNLFDYAHIVVMTRPSCLPPDCSPFLRQRLCGDFDELTSQMGGRLFFQSVTALDISATQIRCLIGQSRDPRFLLPDAVIRYIRLHQLYLSPVQDSECKQNNS